MKIVSVAEMRELERQTEASGISTTILMEQAGYQVAKAIRDKLNGAAGRHVTVLVGPGNNGGDALVAARHLHDWGALLHLFLLADRPTADPNYTAVLSRNVRITTISLTPLPEPVEGTVDHPNAALDHALTRADVVLDGILGIGKSRPLEGTIQATLDATNNARAHRPDLLAFALDIPTGLDADTGALDPSAFRADLTITLGAPKLGLFAYPGASAVGELQVVDIGIPSTLCNAGSVELMTPALIRTLLPNRPSESNKGTYGRVLAVTGSGNYLGAAVLAGRGALRIGAGLVTIATPKGVVRSIAGSLAEATYLPLPETTTGAIAKSAVLDLEPVLRRYNVMLLGCGLGTHDETQAFVADLISNSSSLPDNLVIDADALNILANVPNWWTHLHQSAVLTPHPGEMARLLNTSIEDVQRDRIATAKAAAQEWRCVVVLKGAYTVVASPDGPARISPFAVPALSTPGTGDVLAGATAGLLAQGLTPFDAATAAVYVHALAGHTYSNLHGDTGLLADDLASMLPDALHDLSRGN